MKFSPSPLIRCLFCAAILLLAAPVSAVYDFEGIPLHMTAQGEVRGDVLTFGTYGLEAPPIECTFSLPDKPIWARVYTGVWGGTERYTGWEELTVNNGVPVRRSLFGKDDQNEETYVSGYGVYWIAHDCTDQLHGGKNTVSLTTSRGLPESRIDGRAYGIFVVAVVEDKDGPTTRYWIAEGNENLHGEGWAGTNPTRHDKSEISFEKAGLLEGATADLTILLLASTKGQPDYVRFNGEDLGVAPDDPSLYPAGARDIGNERCFDATGGLGTEARYVDVETFDVGALLKETNHVLFERGRDLDDDGTITTTGDKPEGEDYIHPCCAILTVKRPGADPAPDLSVDIPEVRGAYAGEEATVQATVRNHGARPEGMITAVFSVDGEPVETITVEPDVSGVQEVAANVTLDEGRHTLSVRVDAGNDLDPADNEASDTVRVGTIPDLAVKIGTPTRTGAGEPDTQHSPSPFCALVAGLCIAVLLARRPPGGKLAAMLIAGAVIAASCPLAISPAAAAGYEDYTVPVTITNLGGSDTPPFDLTVYLDGEKAAVKPVDGGLEAGATVDIALSHFTTPGKHRLRVVADEAGTIRDADRGNNAAEGDYVFP
ncbi:DUF3344 domain-containing protein [Methanofollis formosanus]|uniref:DUF3344 domain-containing protein n=1 Tax=Methanofollis formosanus TaxID=299308 RepID=A0A8G1A4J1_9EURY|nr:DUF3344 domain-containing protein [Methanofollis formosanus]